MSKDADHYAILGLSKEASEQDIKKAFRKLSFQTHPDKNPNVAAHEIFKQVNQAYEILGDSENRKQYDLQRQMKDAPFGRNGFPFGNGSNVHATNVNSMFESIFKEHMGQSGSNIRFQMNGQGGPNIQIFHNGRPVHVQNQPPPPIVQHIQLSLEQSYNGGEIHIDSQNKTPSNKIKFEIPKGICDNEKIILKQMGNMSADNKIQGDVHIIFHIQKHAIFERKNMDLYCKKKITLKEALCGFSFEITHLNGKILRINNDSQLNIIYPGYKREIPQYGMSLGDNTGTLYIEFEVDFPTELTQEQRDVIATTL